MTKDWDAVQDEIRELSFTQKKPLEEVKELMERKHKFRASTRAYRMKLKEWGFMRHKPRKTRTRKPAKEGSHLSSEDEDAHDRELSPTAEPMSVDDGAFSTVREVSLEWQEKQGGFHVVPDADETAEPTFMGLLSRPRNLQPSIDPWSQARTRASEIVLDMLEAILNSDSQKLEELIVQNINHINDPVGLPFETPNSRFYRHPAMNKMVILQHPDQTLLDIACGMPCGPVIWVLLSHGATGSKHPLGTDLALHNAIKNGRSYTAQALLVPGRSNVNGLPGTKWKPLLQAVFWTVPEVVSILLRHGANVDDTGPSPHGTGQYTALQLCLQHRIMRYSNPPIREGCIQILKMLLDAGADIHVAPTEGSTLSAFEMFIKPWEAQPYWFMRPAQEELDCLQAFISKGAILSVPFNGCRCGSKRSKTFDHQVLWHSTPRFARSIINDFVVSMNNDGCTILHEVLGFCPDAKRHPADTLRDIQVLLQKGVDPNLPDAEGLTPLMKCLERCPAVDLVPRLQMLIDGGADPEIVDADGDLPYVHAARTFEEPLLSEVMQVLVSKIQGRHVNTIDNTPYTWGEGHFPISETQTYKQVLSCTRQTGDFKLHMRMMVPEDVQPAFQRAYFSVISKNYLDTMTRVVKSKMLDPTEKQEIVWIVSMRKGIDLPAYNFDQELVIALLDCQPLPILLEAPAAPITAPADPITNTTSSPLSSLSSSITITAPTHPSPPHKPFQFDPNNPTLTSSSSSPSSSPSSPPSHSPRPTDSFLDLAFDNVGTTQIRWQHPCRKSTTPSDLKKAVAAVQIYECGVCANGTLLTKAELEIHEVEHAHTEKCKEPGCERRFCGVRRVEGGCQDHLFAG